MSPCSAATPSASTTTTASPAAPARPTPSARAPPRRATPTTPSHAPHLGEQLEAARPDLEGLLRDPAAPGSLAFIASDPAISDGTQEDRALCLQAFRLHQLRLGAGRPAPRRADRRLRPARRRPGGRRPADLRPDRAQSVQRDAWPARPKVPADCDGGNIAALIARGDRVVGELVDDFRPRAAWRSPENVAIVITFDEGSGKTPRGLLRRDPGRAVQLRRRPHPDHRRSPTMARAASPTTRPTTTIPCCARSRTRSASASTWATPPTPTRASSP